MTTSINLTEAQIAGLAVLKNDLGFKSVSHLVRHLCDDAITKHGMTCRRYSGWKRKPGEIMRRVIGLKPGTRFVAAQIAADGEDLQSVGTTLHYLHRDGKIGLLRGARRIGGAWEPAVFVRKDL
jgi:hypothetical protein